MGIYFSYIHTLLNLKHELTLGLFKGGEGGSNVLGNCDHSKS